MQGAVALILIGIGVIIGLAICRRRSALPVKDGPDDFTIPSYVSAQRIEPRIRYSGDSRRSQRASLYIEENRNGKPFSLSLIIRKNYSKEKFIACFSRAWPPAKGRDRRTRLTFVLVQIEIKKGKGKGSIYHTCIMIRIIRFSRIVMCIYQVSIPLNKLI